MLDISFGLPMIFSLTHTYAHMYAYIHTYVHICTPKTLNTDVILV